MRMASKGQIMIPKRIRRRQAIRAGSKFEFAERGASIVVSKSVGRKRGRRPDREFAAYLDRVTGIVDIGMTTAEFMEWIRGGGECV